MTVLQTGQFLTLGHLLHMTRCMQGIMMVLLMFSQHTTQSSSFLRSSFTLLRVCMHLSSISLSCSFVMLLASIFSPSSVRDMNQFLACSCWLATRISALQSLANFSSTSCANNFSVAIQSSICLSDSNRITCSDNTFTSQSVSLQLGTLEWLLSRNEFLQDYPFSWGLLISLTLMLMGNLNLSTQYSISECKDSRLMSLVQTLWPFDFIFSSTRIIQYNIPIPQLFIQAYEPEP